ncbi:MAG: zinc ABC transporter substrate-binding protein [Planctomycetia bacterium]|nr:zinc ABC transporter substrate-binding protein [Planctomycetia bacterium]
MNVIQRLSFKVIAIVLMLAGLAGCKSEISPSRATLTYQGSGPINIVCTTGMVADLVANIGQKHVKVTQLMKAGVDPHLYKASPGDMRLFNESDVIFYSGHHLEGKMTELLEQLNRKKVSLPVTEKIDSPSLLRTEENVVDPHLWFDVKLWQQASYFIRDELCRYDPSHAADYRAASAAYDKQLEEMDKYAREQLGTIEKSRRVLVTAHDAFRYFGKAYDVEVKSIQGISTESEASVKDINELVNFIVARKIKAVFVETSVSEKNIKALVEGCAAQNHAVIVGGELFSDAPGEEGKPDATYLGMVKHNVDVIVKALK